MNTSRRSFIKKSAITIAGTALFSHSILAQFKKQKLVGVQLYSVRDAMKANPLETLQQLSKIGYKNVEHANYVDRKFYGYNAREFKKVLDDLGLKMVSGHTVMRSQHWDAAAKDFTNEWKYTIEDAAVLGQRFVISPWMDESLRKNYDELMRFLELFNRSGELCKKSGMMFGYHNHDFEFNTNVNGKNLYDIILQNTDPKLVIQQLDMGNMYDAGGRALNVIEKYPGRFLSMHVKDEIKGSGEGGHQYESTILGKGVIDVKKVLDLAQNIGGTEHFIIEQESYQGQNPLDAVKEDLEIMKKWGF
jgi:sugar phosphate isomerase/epimerase